MTITAPPQGETFLVRPFLTAARSVAPSARADSGIDEVVRAYTMTSGRAHASTHLAFEAMLRTSAVGATQLRRLYFERRTIVRLCMQDATSVAELSARLRLPIGVIRVLAADLVAEGLLDVFTPRANLADDVDFLAGLIASVRAL